MGLGVPIWKDLQDIWIKKKSVWEHAFIFISINLTPHFRLYECRVNAQKKKKSEHYKDELLEKELQRHKRGVQFALHDVAQEG